VIEKRFSESQAIHNSFLKWGFGALIPLYVIFRAKSGCPQSGDVILKLALPLTLALVWPVVGGIFDLTAGHFHLVCPQWPQGKEGDAKQSHY
jgi:hypothetical protein